MNDQVTLTIKMETLNLIMRAVAKLPWDAANPIIVDIETQVKAQLEQPGADQQASNS
jgi:hypothetical protein